MIGGSKREGLGVEMGGPDYDEAVGRKVARERAVAVQGGEVVGGAVPVREQEDGQLASGHGRQTSYR